MLPSQIRAGTFWTLFELLFWRILLILPMTCGKVLWKSVLCGRRWKLFPFPCSIHRYSVEHENFDAVTWIHLHAYAHSCSTFTWYQMSFVCCKTRDFLISNYLFWICFMLILFSGLLMFHELRLCMYPSLESIFNWNSLTSISKPRFFRFHFVASKRIAIEFSETICPTVGSALIRIVLL